MTASEAADAQGQAGALICVAGASGAGKDSLINAARAHFADDPGFHFPLRYITRRQTPDEPHLPLSVPDYEGMLAAGEFFLHWRAHGAAYGIGRDAQTALRAGRIVVVNVSRAIIGEARAAWPRTALVHISVRPEILRSRLQSRGRDGEIALEARLQRADDASVPMAAWVYEIDNSGEFAVASQRFIALIGRLGKTASAPQRETPDQPEALPPARIAE